MLIREKTDTWRQDEEIRMINEKLDFYVMEASDEEFDTEEVRKLVKRLDELDPILFFAEVKCRLLQNAMYVGCCKIDLGGYTPKPL